MIRKQQRSSPPSSVRIVAGRLRGSRLAVADADGLRPTPERVRETLFNWLAPMIDGARCLDLFAGTGALGIEALSRGAAECVFCERDAELAAALEANLARLGVAAAARVVGTDATAFLTAHAPTPFDVVFIDPPFAASLWDGAARRLERGGWLADHSMIHVEAPVELALQLPPNWIAHRAGRAGAVRFALYRRVAADRLS